MQGSSTGALAAVAEAVDGQLSDGADAASLGEELFSLARALDGAHSLRRALTEPAVPQQAKARLLRSLFGDRLGEPTLAVAEAGTGKRWSSPRDFPDALEQASVTAHVARADAEGRLDALEDNLFRFARISEASPGLRDALGDMAAPWEGKRQLVHDLVGDKVDDVTTALLGQAVAGRHRSLTSVLTTYQRVAAGRRDSMIATVWVAAPLSDEHRDRLTQALSAQHDKQVHLNVVVDPTVLGGVRVSLGDEVIDSTVETRLRQAQRRLER
jgi:F-type H+-transporting ATPase subunit delta